MPPRILSQIGLFLGGMITASVIFSLFFISLSPQHVPEPPVLPPLQQLGNLSDPRKDDVRNRIRYWNYPNKPINRIQTPHFDRVFTWMPYSAGLNNRRISLEFAYTFAYLTNRTMILPPGTGVMYPFPKPGLMEEMFDYDEMRAVVPMITWVEWQKSAHRARLEKEVLYVNWSFVDGQSVFVWPEAPTNTSEEYQSLLKTYKVRNVRDPGTYPTFNESSNIFFPEMSLFPHFYTQFYFRPYSEVQLKDVTRLIRDRIHFPEAAAEWAARILYHMPSSFAAMHYRRSDFGPGPRQITPGQVFNNTANIYKEGEYIYVCTDEEPVLFESDFVNTFKKRNPILSWQDFRLQPYTQGIPPMYVPMVEMIIAGQSRIFVGTMWSTFSGYIQRLRGYNQHIANKTYFTTTLHTGSQVGEKWALEFEQAWTFKRNLQVQTAYDLWET